jgi:prepilin-type N-terminal cleavage/methylation domain-containing protein
MKLSKVQHKGFSLIEVLVALSLFTIVMMVSVGAFLSVLDANRKTQALQRAMDNVFLSIENMTRLIRTGTIYECGEITGNPTTADCSSGAGENSIQFYDDTGRIVRFYLNNNAIMKQVDGTGTSGDYTYPITSPEFYVENLLFYVTGTDTYYDGSDDVAQPTVTIVITGLANRGQETETEMRLQTTVTQRVIDL